MDAKPWKARLVESGGYDCMTDSIHIVTDILAPSIAVLDLSHYGQKPCEGPTPETLAEAWKHARLIAEAPAMRAELEALAAQLEDWDDGMPGEARTLLRERAKPIRALLARIDGTEAK